MTILYTHPDCLGHDLGDGHPERPERLKAVLAALDHPDFAALDRREAPLGEIEDIARVHPVGFATALLAAVPGEGRVRIDADTVMSPGSGDAVLRAVGAIVSAVDAVLGDEAKTAFCAVRPPDIPPNRSRRWVSVCSTRSQSVRRAPRRYTG